MMFFQSISRVYDILYQQVQKEKKNQTDEVKSTKMTEVKIEKKAQSQERERGGVRWDVLRLW